MYYITVAQRGWSKSLSPANKNSRTSQPSEAEIEKAKTSKLATAKTKEYIRNVQESYFIERRMFS
jgi:hypothetical protein